VPKNERDDESDILFPPAVPPKSRPFNHALSVLPWALCIILSAALFALASDHRRAYRHGSYETGFDTDLGKSRNSLKPRSRFFLLTSLL
jgi:hypothetical protein